MTLTLILMLLLPAVAMPIKPVLGADQSQYLLYKNTNYGFSIEYPATWYHEDLTATAGNLSPVAYFAPDSKTTNTWLSVNYQKDSTTLRGLSGQQILNTLTSSMQHNCQLYSLRSNGFTCSNSQFKSNVETYRGLPSYEVTNTWTKTLPDGSTLDMISILAMVPVQNDLYAIVIRLSTEAASVYQSELSHMLSSFNIYSVSKETVTQKSDYSNYGLQKGESITYKYSMTVDASDAETKQAVTNTMLQSLSQSMGNVTLNSIDDVQWIKYTITNVSSTNILFNEETKIRNLDTLQNYRDIKYLQGMIIPITAKIGDSFSIFASGSDLSLQGTVKGIKTINLRNTDVPVFQLLGSKQNVSQDGSTISTVTATAFYDKKTGLMLNALLDVDMMGAKYVKMHIEISTIDWSGLGTSVPAYLPPSTTIPSWIKNTAKLWVEGSITNSDFVKGIEYLIQKGLITVPPTTVTEQSQTIPSWIKNTAKLWVEGSITDSDFVKSIQYLVQNGIISTTISIQTLDSITKSVNILGGTLSLSGGSNVIIPPNVITSDQSVSLSLVSSLPQQPPSGIIVGVGPALVITLKPTQTSYHDSGVIPLANALNQSSDTVQVTLNVDNTKWPRIDGSEGIADIVDLQGKDHFVGIPEDCDSSYSICTFTLQSSVIPLAQKIALGQVNLNTMVTGAAAPRFGPRIWNGQSFVDFPQGFDPNKKTLVITHGILSTTESAYGDCIDSIKSAGNYDQVIGFNYDFTKDLSYNGQLLASFLDLLKKNYVSQIDLEAHSLGTVVALSAAGQTSMKINNMVLEGGPLDGTPAASIGMYLGNKIANSNIPLPITANSLKEMYESGLVRELLPGSPTLSQIKRDVVINQPNTHFIKVAGNKQSKIEDFTSYDPFNGQPNDGVIPTSSATSKDLPGPPALVYNLSHTDLECDSNTIKGVGVQVNQHPLSVSNPENNNQQQQQQPQQQQQQQQQPQTGYGNEEEYCQGKYGSDYHYESSTNKCVSYGKYDSGEAYCQGTHGSDYHYDASQHLCVPSSSTSSKSGQQGAGTTGGTLGSTISSRGPLTGHYTGTFTLVDTYTGATCKFQSTFVADFTQSGNSISGTVSYASASSEAALSGGTTIHCSFGGASYSLSGTVSSSSFTLTSLDGELTASGSFTSDLIHGTFRACSEGLCDDGTFTGSKR